MRILVLMILAGLCASAFAVPQQSPAQAHADRSDARPPKTSKHTVGDGECHTNNDGVEVCNTGTSGDDITIDPRSGNTNSATTVEVKNDAEGTVENLDSNDTVNTAHGSSTEISGTGGTVNAGSGSTGSVTNTNAAGGSGASITVNIGGGSITVPPGGTVNFAG